MKYKVIGVLVLCLLLVSFSVHAINFKAEEVYNSIVVIRTASGSGSGFAVEENVILTNAHVVGTYNTVEVELYDKTTIKGSVIKVDEDIDLALVQVNKTISPLEFNTETPEIGQDVYVIGAPKDMSYTMTKGIVSALDRTLGENKYLQIDASVNSGNSGGPLLDENGKVLGVITLKKTDAEGIGFAVRSEDADKFLNDIPFQDDVPEEENGEKSPPWAGLKGILPEDNILLISLLASVMLNIALTVVVICLIIKKKAKPEIKDEYDFEIDIEEL